MFCLWCNNEIIIEISWVNVIKPSKPKKLCHDCSHKLEVIKGSRCSVCSRSYQGDICYDCERWKTDDPLVFNHSLFTYNERMQEIIAKWKYRGDYILGEVFRDLFLETFHTVFSFLNNDAVVVPIPLSEERMLERGFNQAKVLANFLPLETKSVMTRIFSEKQAKKTRRERISMRNPFNLQEKINKSVVLVDDIYTTGTTLRHAATLLKQNGCPKIYSYTLIRG